MSDNILVVGLYYGNKKPDDMSPIILPFAKELRRIYDNNGFSVKHGFFSGDTRFLPMVTHCSCDLPAKSMMQEFVSFSAYKACGYCKHPGVSVQKGSKQTGKSLEIINAKKSVKLNKYVRYIRRANIDLRNHKDTLLAMMKKSKKSKDSEPIDGVTGVSCMVGFKNFDLIDEFSIDYMHCVLLGTMKKLMDFWLNSCFYQKEFHISKGNAAILNTRIMSIKPPSNISRKPRSLDDRSKFKADEYRSLLLYYLPCCLSGLLPVKYIKHFQLLSSAIYILLKSVVISEDIGKAEIMLNNFADEYEVLYGIDTVTMNIHLLRHIPNSVRNCGPLWTHSLFGFETCNGVLAKSVNGNNRIVEEMANKYILKRTLKFQEKKSQSLVLKSCSFVGKGRKKALNELERVVFENHNISLVDKNICIWQSMHWKKQFFTSTKYKEVKAIDYFVCFSDGSLGTVQYYFKHDNTSYALFEKFETLSRANHILEVKSTSLHLIQKIEDIVDKLVFVKIYNKSSVIRFPNKNEKT